MSQLDFSALVAKANNDGEFAWAARYWNGRLEFVFGSDATLLQLSDGRISVADGGAAGQVEIQIRADAEHWDKALLPVPPAGWHDVYTSKYFTVTADVLDFGPYYLAIHRLLDLMTEQLHGAKTVVVPPNVRQAHEHDDAVGRYVYVDVLGEQYRVYYEETGHGIPMLLMHTAGADGRQWRHVLENRGYQEQFRMISIDLPYHGKSLPPAGAQWWGQEYTLTREFLLTLLDALILALDLHRPVFMGCSVGGMLAPDLAYYRPGQYRSVIALNGALAMPTANLADPAKTRSWHHPRVSNEWKASSMLGFMSPTSPEATRRETAWVYSQGAPPVFYGDLFYYMQDHDLTAEQAATIDTGKTGVYMLTGEYDPLALSGLSEKLADAIDGVYFEISPGIGHFGPSENPEAFAQTLDPVLADITAKFSD